MGSVFGLSRFGGLGFSACRSAKPIGEDEVCYLLSAHERGLPPSVQWKSQSSAYLELSGRRMVDNGRIGRRQQGYIEVCFATLRRPTVGRILPYLVSRLYSELDSQWESYQ